MHQVWGGLFFRYHFLIVVRMPGPCIPRTLQYKAQVINIQYLLQCSINTILPQSRLLHSPSITLWHLLTMWSVSTLPQHCIIAVLTCTQKSSSHSVLLKKDVIHVNFTPTLWEQHLWLPDLWPAAAVAARRLQLQWWRKPQPGGWMLLQLWNLLHSLSGLRGLQLIVKWSKQVSFHARQASVLHYL